MSWLEIYSMIKVVGLIVGILLFFIILIILCWIGKGEK